MSSTRSIITTHPIRITLLFSLLISGSGCGLLLGNVKPVEEKSESVGILDLTQADPDWQKLAPKEESGGKKEVRTTEIPDVAYQSKHNASTVSLNSACRLSNSEATGPNGERLEPREELKNFTRELLFGIGEIEFREERQTVLQGVPALDTRVRGKLGEEPVALRVVVLRRETCVYDLMYVSRPDKYSEKEPDFERFVSSLRIR